MSWDPTTWKRSHKLILGVATIWPLLYMVLFIVVIFSVTSYLMFREQRLGKNSASIDLVELQQKIRNNELSRLTVKQAEIVACDRTCDCEYHTSVNSGFTRAEILRLARETDENGKPRVPIVEEDTASPRTTSLFPVGIVVLFALHFFTICLMLALMVVYIVLAVTREHFDQTMRTVWIILLCLMNVYVMPVYWYLYVWRASPAPQEPAPNPA